MLTMLSKLLISRSLDEGRAPPAWIARRIGRSAELRRFAASAARLDRALSATPPPAEEPSPFLAARIRASVESAPAAGGHDSVWSPRTVLGVCAAALALAGVLVGVRLLVPGPAPGSGIARGSTELSLQIPSPRRLVASIERPIQAEMQQFWYETRRVGVEVFDRFMPSPPKGKD